MRYARAIAVGLCCILCITTFLGGCATTPPVRRETYVVRPQDTLYSIAWRHDVDFRDLAKWNNIGPDYRLVVGQILVMQPDAGSTEHHAARADGAAPSARAQGVARVGKPKPLPDTAGAAVTPNAADAPGAPAAPGATDPGGTALWVWPTEHSAPPRPVPGGGILLFGKLGQDVRAAGAGRVVYIGSGIRGYGNLIIVKHRDNLLSSYAHNSEMFVHEGQDVFVGQLIAHMGTAAHQTSALYFEIRLNGKPVDPLRYLPVAK